MTAFASYVRSQLRSTDLVGRYGGEEFGVLLYGAGEDEGRHVAERLRAGVASLSLEVDGRTLHFTVSIGLTTLGNGDLQAALSAADRALYEAKRLGRNRVSNGHGPIQATPIGLRPA